MLANIPTFTPADFEDNDTYGEDCSAEMTNRQTTITSVELASVSRSDNRPITVSDMQISNITVLSAGLKYGWKGIGGIASTTYYIKFVLSLASGDTIYRTVCVMTPEFVG